MGSLSYASIVLIIFNFMYGYWTKALTNKTSFIVCLLMVNLINIFLTIFFPIEFWTVFMTLIVSFVFMQWRVYLVAYMISDF